MADWGTLIHGYSFDDDIYMLSLFSLSLLSGPSLCGTTCLTSGYAPLATLFRSYLTYVQCISELSAQVATSAFKHNVLFCVYAAALCNAAMQCGSS